MIGLQWTQVAYLNNAGVSLMEKGRLDMAKDVLHLTVNALRSVASQGSWAETQIHELTQKAACLLADADAEGAAHMDSDMNCPFRIDPSDYEEVSDVDAFLSSACVYNLATCCLRQAETSCLEDRNMHRQTALRLLQLSRQCLADTPQHELPAPPVLRLCVLQHQNILTLLQGAENTPAYTAVRATMARLNLAAHTMLVLDTLGASSCMAAAA